MVIETERLILKDLEMNDLEDFFTYARDKNVGSRSTWKPHESIEESREILEEFVASGEFFGIHHKEDGLMIGVVGLHEDELSRMPRTRCREIGYGLNYNYWSRGYMTEAARLVLVYAFEKLGLDLVTGYTSENNERSKRVLSKIGLNFEGILKLGWHNYKGDYRDRYSYSLTREEFENQSKRNCIYCGCQMENGHIYAHKMSMKWVGESDEDIPLFYNLNDEIKLTNLSKDFSLKASYCRECNKIIIELEKD